VPVDRPVLVAFAEQPLSLSGHTRYISNLMCWRDLDVGLLVGPAYGPRDVLHLISRVMELPAVVVGFDHRGERADHRPTGLVKEERYHVPFQLARGAPASGASTFRSGCTIFMTTSRRGMRRCVTRSPMSSARRCCGSTTCGFGCRATRIKSVASRSHRRCRGRRSHAGAVPAPARWSRIASDLSCRTPENRPVSYGRAPLSPPADGGQASA
jgi:hypothetical protein